MMQHKALIVQHWPELQLTRKGLERRLSEELAVKDELSGPKSRVLLTLAPEQVCHRLLWALGDSIPTEVALKECESKLQQRFPQSHVRCSDHWLRPASVIRTLFGITSLLLILGLRAAILAAWNVYDAEPPIPGKKRKVDLCGPTWEEVLDQLSARLILASSLAYLWLLYGIAAAFPLRSLHSPFQQPAQLVPVVCMLCRDNLHATLRPTLQSRYRLLQASENSPVPCLVLGETWAVWLLIPELGRCCSGPLNSEPAGTLA